MENIENQQSGVAGNVVGVLETTAAAFLGAVEHPVTTIERAAGAVVADVEHVAADVKVEVEDLTEKVRAYFHSMNGAHLEDALVAIATRVQALEATVTDLREFIGK